MQSSSLKIVCSLCERKRSQASCKHCGFLTRRLSGVFVYVSVNVWSMCLFQTLVQGQITSEVKKFGQLYETQRARSTLTSEFKFRPNTFWNYNIKMRLFFMASKRHVLIFLHFSPQTYIFLPIHYSAHSYEIKTFLWPSIQLTIFQRTYTYSLVFCQKLWILQVYVQYNPLYS